MTTEFQEHKVEWTREKAERFWAYLADRDGNNSFGYVVGDAIISETLKHGTKLSGRVLDYGCGPGFFLEKLIERGISCEGAEFSKETIEIVKEKFNQNKLFKDCSLLDENSNALVSNSFDTVFFIETIEHIMPNELDQVLKELFRIIKPGGSLIITTPNNEPIEKRNVICPDCGGIFHRVQHVTSWSSQSLTIKMENSGFISKYCSPVVFRKPSIFNFIRDIFWKVEKREMPHLFYAGKKPV
jgi:2-polyprenyl-3-methyl-5-hydroxy-6-metoxy-1,4-benzoquinol methylase